MAPGKFGLFKGRSREGPEPPSTENLLASCSDVVVYSESSLPSTSQGLYEDQHSFQELALLHLDSDDEDDSERGAIARRSSVSVVEEAQINYNPLPSTNPTSVTTLPDTFQDQDQDHDFQVHLDDIQHYEVVSPDDATSVDANSLQFDETSIYSGDDKCTRTTKKQRKQKAKKVQQLQQQHNDYVMWAASNYEVLQHLLARNGTLDELIKWEAIATARGICTLTATCSCDDCSGGHPPIGCMDGEDAMGAAPLLGIVSVGCVVM